MTEKVSGVENWYYQDGDESEEQEGVDDAVLFERLELFFECFAFDYHDAEGYYLGEDEDFLEVGGIWADVETEEVGLEEREVSPEEIFVYLCYCHLAIFN